MTPGPPALVMMASLSPGGPLHLVQGFRAAEELTDSVHPDDSRTAKRRIVGFILSGECPGV